MSTILAIESSCDETSASVCVDGQLRSNVISSQLQHSGYGGVIPELASRLHQQQIVRVVQEAMQQAKVTNQDLTAVAFTRGPGLMGALMVGTCFAKAFALGLDIPLIAVNHMHAHVLANFLKPDVPAFPFLCLTVSGGHTQLVLAKGFRDLTIVGETKDDAAGEAYDKAAKMLGLGYPGGPEIDRRAALGDPNRFEFAFPRDKSLDFSFSGMKTSLLYFLRDGLKNDPEFIAKNINDICASFQNRVVTYLLRKFELAAKHYHVSHLAIAGGVSANKELRRRFGEMCARNDWQSHIPEFQYCTDNAGMIAITGHYQFLAGEFCDQSVVPFSRERNLEN
jgi:N6-L-threonylcarbamoyladenine synthase